VGFGTDIGGSIRIPSAYNGLYSLRPSHGRLPYEGLANSMQGQNSILSVVGPLATSLASLKLVTQALLTQQPWLADPLVNDLPWRDSKEDEIYAIVKAAHGNGNGNGSGGLAFGILHDDGIVRPTPPVRRALALTASALRRLGHTVIPWQPPSHATGLALANETWSFDGGADVHGAFALSGEDPAAQLSAHFGPAPVAEYTASRVAAVNVRKREYQRAYLEYWNGTAALTGTGRPVDGVIAPVAPYPAARPGGSTTYAYTTIFNVLDYTAATFPVTTADKDVDVADATFASLSGAPADEQTWKLYDPAVYDGAWVGLQVVGRRLQEEGVLALAGVIDEALKNNE
jgi:amidase